MASIPTKASGQCAIGISGVPSKETISDVHVQPLAPGPSVKSCGDDFDGKYEQITTSSQAVTRRDVTAAIAEVERSTSNTSSSSSFKLPLSPADQPTRPSLTAGPIMNGIRLAEVLIEARSTKKVSHDYRLIMASLRYCSSGVKPVVFIPPVQLLTDLSRLTGLLDGFNDIIVQELLKFKFFSLDETYVKPYATLLVEIARSIVFYQEGVCQHLLISLANIEEGTIGEQSTSQRTDVIFRTFQTMITDLPHFQDSFLRQIAKALPFMTKPWKVQVHMFEQMLRFVDYVDTLPNQAPLAFDILSRLIHKLIDLDCHCPKEEILAVESETHHGKDVAINDSVKKDSEDSISIPTQFVMDTLEEKDSDFTNVAGNAKSSDSISAQTEGIEMKHALSNTLDRLMELFFKYIDTHVTSSLLSVNSCHNKPEKWVQSATETTSNVNNNSVSNANGLPNIQASTVRSLETRAAISGTVVDSVNVKKAKLIYRRFLAIFDKYVLATYKCMHVQFLMFFLVSKRPLFADHLIDHLWQRVQDPNIPTLLRRVAVSYLGSLLSRGTFVSVGTLKDILSLFGRFLHGYLKQSSITSYAPVVDPYCHSVFYSVCQALMYCIAFRHKEISDSQDGLNFMRNLGLEQLVTSPLNPLKVISKPVAMNFANVSRYYQLVYCHAIIERNQRNALPMAPSKWTSCHRPIWKGSKFSDSSTKAGPLFGLQNSHNQQVDNEHLNSDEYFPFDPYVLVRSSRFVIPIYRKYYDHLELNEVSSHTADDKNIFNNDDEEDKSALHSGAVDPSEDFVGMEVNASSGSGFSSSSIPIPFPELRKDNTVARVARTSNVNCLAQANNSTLPMSTSSQSSLLAMSVDDTGRSLAPTASTLSVTTTDRHLINCSASPGFVC